MTKDKAEAVGLSDIPVLQVAERWTSVFQGAACRSLEAALPRFMLPRRWFGSKARPMAGVAISEAMPILPSAYLVMLRVEYVQGEPDIYVLPIAFASGPEAEALARERPAAVIARLRAGVEDGVLYDAVWNPSFCRALLETIVEGRQYQGTTGDVVASAAARLPGLAGDAPGALPPILLGVEQSNTSIRFGERLILKLYRRLEAGVNPDQEIGRFLTEAGYTNTPPLAGAMEFRRHETDSEPVTLALLQGFVPNQGDAWKYTLDTLAEYYARVAGPTRASGLRPDLPETSLLELAHDEIPADVERVIGPYLGSARLLGRRTGELHLALGAATADPAFAPEPFTGEFQGYLRQNMRDLTARIMHLLKSRLDALAEADAADARRVLALEGEIMARFDGLLEQPVQALLTRIHGDYHLGQVLYTGDDFMMIDFEGEPARPLSERRMKRSPLQDVAGMLRSFHYAAYSGYFACSKNSASAVELESWARFWHVWVSVAYLQTYLDVVKGAAFIPATLEQLKLLLDAYLVEKAVYELGYELNNRPTWARIPLQGILATVEGAQH